MIKNISFEQQRDTMDCGVSCLIMTAGYYGKSTDRDRLRLLSDLSKDGVSLLGISKAAEEIGFKTVGGRLGFETLAEEAPLPCIVHWNQNLQVPKRSAIKEYPSPRDADNLSLRFENVCISRRGKRDNQQYK